MEIKRRRKLKRGNVTRGRETENRDVKMHSEMKAFSLYDMHLHQNDHIFTSPNLPICLSFSPSITLISLVISHFLQARDLGGGDPMKHVKIHIRRNL